MAMYSLSETSDRCLPSIFLPVPQAKHSSFFHFLPSSHHQMPFSLGRHHPSWTVVSRTENNNHVHQQKPSHLQSAAATCRRWWGTERDVSNKEWRGANAVNKTILRPGFVGNENPRAVKLLEIKYAVAKSTQHFFKTLISEDRNSFNGACGCSSDRQRGCIFFCW